MGPKDLNAIIIIVIVVVRFCGAPAPAGASFEGTQAGKVVCCNIK